MENWRKNNNPQCSYVAWTSQQPFYHRHHLLAAPSPPPSFGSTITTQVLGYFLERPFRWPLFGSKHIFLTQVSPCSKASCGMMSAVMTRPACRGGGAASRDLSELVARLQRCNNTRESPPPHHRPPPPSEPTLHFSLLDVNCAIWKECVREAGKMFLPRCMALSRCWYRRKIQV